LVQYEQVKLSSPFAFCWSFPAFQLIATQPACLLSRPYFKTIRKSYASSRFQTTNCCLKRREFGRSSTARRNTLRYITNGRTRSSKMSKSEDSRPSQTSSRSNYLLNRLRSTARRSGYDGRTCACPHVKEHRNAAWSDAQEPVLDVK
jgi:hypothetical protein